jgi:FkbM family methyltransferase
MSATIARARREAGALRRRLFPPPEVAAWRRACRLAETTPRHTAGTIEMAGLRLRYPDLLTFCPQWHDIFVARSLAFDTAKPRPRILDCGANIGLASLFFKRAHPGARITAFEADPAIAAMLADNLRDNGAADVDVVPAAVWTRDGDVSFVADGADSGALASVGGPIDGRRVSVPARRLRTIIEREPIDLLKLDIEGAEADVLADCEEALASVNALLVEIHEIDGGARRAPAILERLTRAGFAYAVTHVTPLPWRQPAGTSTPFPGRSAAWVEAVGAWRPRA